MTKFLLLMFGATLVACTLGSLQNFPSGVTFTLTVNQTSPSAGSGSVAGIVSGQIAFNPSFSSLVWTPSPSSLTLGTAGLTGTYALILDNIGPGWSPSSQITGNGSPREAV
jgi:hypothetical protein